MLTYGLPRSFYPTEAIVLKKQRKHYQVAVRSQYVLRESHPLAQRPPDPLPLINTLLLRLLAYADLKSQALAAAILDRRRRTELHLLSRWRELHPNPATEHQDLDIRDRQISLLPATMPGCWQWMDLLWWRNRRVQRHTGWFGTVITIGVSFHNRHASRWLFPGTS
jgi:hypothetical protein